MMKIIHDLLVRVTYGKLLILSLLSLVINFAVFGYLVPSIIRMGMAKQLRITPETMARKTFEKIPFPINFRLYLFNVTNKDEVLAGGKPILQEIGPYFFEEHKDKIDIADNDEDDTLEYDFRNTYIYKPEFNGPGLTGEEIVTVAHPLILSTLLLIKLERPELLDFVHRALNGVLNNPKDIFFTGRLWDFLYDGVDIDCSSDRIEVAAVCGEFDSGNYAEVQRFNDTAFKFSMFGGQNGSSIGRFKVLRGKKNIRDVGRIVGFGGAPMEMDAWHEDECNEIRGTDGTIFPPHQDKVDGYTFFIPQMCRVLKGEYYQPSEYDGIKTNQFKFDFDVTKYGTPNCYCRDGEKCPPKGITDLYPCLGTPIAISAPHFYNVDPTIAEKVGGLSPDRDKHDFTINFYQFAGVPLQVTYRFQVNIDVSAIESIPYMKNLQTLYMPVLWFEGSSNLPKKYVDMLKHRLVLGEKIRVFMRWTTAIIGGLALLFGIIFCCFQFDEVLRVSAKSDRTRLLNKKGSKNGLVDNPKVQSIEVISHDL